MITRLNVVSQKVLDQDEALDFYVNKLGLEVAQDFRQGPVRWLTVRVPGGDTEIYLEEPGTPALDEATTEMIRELTSKGAAGSIVAFETDDIRGLYESLRARDVDDFVWEPTDHAYGTDMAVRDPSGNAIRFLQPARIAQQARA